MRKKIFTLLTLMLAVCSGAWGDPTWTLDYSGRKSSWSVTDLQETLNVEGFGTITITYSNNDMCGNAKYAKFSSNTHNITITLPAGKTFKAGDKLRITTKGGKSGSYACLYVADGVLKTNAIPDKNTDLTQSQADYDTGEMTIPGGFTASQSIIIRRATSSEKTADGEHTCGGSLYLQKVYYTESFSVTYDGNGNDGGTVPTDANAYLSGASVTVLGNTGSLTKAGYNFDGWNTASDGTGDDLAVGSSFDISNNTTLYAKWVTSTEPIIITQPQSGVYVKDATGKTLTVAANPSIGECTYAWYKCDNAEKENPVAIEEGTGYNTAEFTIPTGTAGNFYYFCRVGDDGANTTDTEVVRVRISPNAEKSTWDLSSITADDMSLNTEFWGSGTTSFQLANAYTANTRLMLENNFGTDMLNGIRFSRNKNLALNQVILYIGRGFMMMGESSCITEIPVTSGKYYRITYAKGSNSGTYGYEISSGATYVSGDKTYEFTNNDQRGSFIVRATAATINLASTSNYTTLSRVEEVPALSGAWTPTSSTVYQNDDAPTPTFAPSTSDSSDPSGKYSVVYSTVSDEAGIVTVNPSTGITAIDMSKLGTATIRATITSNVYAVPTATYDYTITINEKVPEYTLNKVDNEISLRSTPVHRSASVSETATVTMEAIFLEGESGTVAFTESVSGLSVSPASFTISDGSVSATEFTITYSSDAGTSGTATLRFTDGNGNKKDLVIEYTSVLNHEWATVTEATTWDWKDLTETEIKLTDSTTPTKSTEFLLGDMNGENLTQDIVYDPATFNADALKVITEYVTRKSNSINFMQGSSVKFKTSVPGTVVVTFSNTGGSRPYRYVKVNETYSTTGSASTTMIETQAIPVSAGEVTIIGYITNASDPVSKEGEIVGPAMLRISKIVFTPTSGPDDPTTSGDEVYLTTSDNMAGWRAFYDAEQGYTLDGNTTAYVATSNDESTVKLTSIGNVPAATPVILYTTSSADSHKMTLTKATVDAYEGTNLLQYTTSAVSGKYRLGYGESGVGFYPYSGTPTSGAVILNVDASARALSIVFDEEETGIKKIESATSDKENGAYFNLAGQRVAQPTKGLYIVNGKKVVIK